MHAPSPDHSFPRDPARPRYRWALHRFACFCAGSILFLICIGGLVTSNNAGMSVPDWPTTYGYNMFYFPFQDWVGGIFFEHTHRLVASAVVSLLSVLAVWLCFQERVWLRWMGIIVPVFGLIEATIGGLRVVLSEDQLGILHGALAQLLFVSVSLIGLFTSRWWLGRRTEFTPPKWTGRVLALCALIFAQLLLGATMRHEHAGLSIDDFPLAYGQVWPKTDPASLAAYNAERLHRNEYATSALYINIQMAHRAGAVLISVGILAAAAAMVLTSGTAPILRRWSAVWAGLVLVQVLLGAFTIWTDKAADIATAHVAVGALTLVLGALLTAMSWRLQSMPELARKGAA
ncbi:MAG: COX15/CtaA family protein [Verrucomicrobiota bacterium]